MSYNCNILLIKGRIKDEKRILSLLAVLCLLVTMLPTAFMATETDGAEKVITFTVESEHGIVVAGTRITIELYNLEEVEGEDYWIRVDAVDIAESTTGIVEYAVSYDAEKDVLVYDGKDYSRFEVKVDLPEGYENADGENEFYINYDAYGGSTDTIYVVEDLSDGDSREKESVSTSETIVENENYRIYKIYEDDVLQNTYILLQYDCSTEIILEALSYVNKEDFPWVVARATEKTISVSKEILERIAELEAAFQLSSMKSAVHFNKVTDTSAFHFEIGKNNNQKLIDKLTKAGVSGGYIQYEFSGAGQEDGIEVGDSLVDGIFTISEDNIDKNQQNGQRVGTEEKYIYYYDVARDLLVSDANIKAVYGEIDDASATLVLEINQRGIYIVSDKTLPESLTNEKIGTEITTDTTVEKEVLEESKENGESVNIQIKETDKSSFVNWYFEKIENVVDFLPTVQVDATIDEINNKIEDIKVTADFKYTTVSFDFDGVLQGKAEVKDGQEIYLYYYNPEKNDFELVDSVTIREGFATFTMTHCSDYIITTEVIAEDAPGIIPPATGDNSVIGVYLLLLVGAVGMIVYASSLKRRCR